MSLVVRKIEYTKWRQRRILEGEQPSADAITNCMKTKGNKLSVWSITDELEFEDAVVAIAAAGTNLDAIDVLAIDKSLIEERKLPLVKSQVDTPYTSFEEKHYDVVDLDYTSLGTMAEVIVESIRKTIEEKRQLRFTITKLTELLIKAVEAGKVQLTMLKPGIRKYVDSQYRGTPPGTGAIPT